MELETLLGKNEKAGRGQPIRIGGVTRFPRLPVQNLRNLADRSLHRRALLPTKMFLLTMQQIALLDRSRNSLEAETLETLFNDCVIGAGLALGLALDRVVPRTTKK